LVLAFGRHTPQNRSRLHVTSARIELHANIWRNHWAKHCHASLAINSAKDEDKRFLLAASACCSKKQQQNATDQNPLHFYFVKSVGAR